VATAEAQVLRVDPTATMGSNNGSSWQNAFVTLDLAITNASAGSTILLAENTYRPTSSPSGGGPRTVSFLLTDGVTIQGGFLGLAAGGPGGSGDPANTIPTSFP
jgi:hypothetical protein